MSRYEIYTGQNHCCRGSRSGFTLPGAEASYAPDLTLEPTHIEIRLRFDLKTRSAAGEVITTVRANRDGARTLRLDAVDLADVTIEAADDSEVSGRHDGRAIHLRWADALTSGEERRVRIRYSVTDPIAGMYFSIPDDSYPDRRRFVATDHETERARYWLPCIDYPTVRTRFDFHLTADAALICLANGLLVGSEDGEDGTRTHHWRLEEPCPSYLCCIAIGDFVRASHESVDGVAIDYYTVAGHQEESLRRSFGRTPQMMRWLTGRLGQKFPYPKYSQIALPDIGGAMENISLVTWDGMFVADETLAAEWGHVIDSINIHEMAHSYFGDSIVCRHFEHSWLKESWAVYIETVYWEENVGREERDFDLVLNADQYFAECESSYVRPIVTRKYNSSWDLFDNHLYPGGAWRIHMLRGLVGDDSFWAAVRDYVATYSGRVVETEDFRRKLEEHSGINLTRFFDEWIMSPGHPKLSVSLKQDDERDEGTIVVEQTQEDEKTGVGLFSFPLEIDYDDEDGTHRLRMEVSERRHAVTFPIAGKVTQICVDPDQKTLFTLKLDPGPEILTRALEDRERSLAHRVQAARTLIEKGTRRGARAVVQAMETEPFWGVRSLVAKAFGESRSGEAIEPLVTMLARESDPRAKVGITRACGRLRDPRLARALREFIARPEQPYWARAAALESLGAQRDEEHFEVLGEPASDDGWHGLVRMGALRGLGALRSRKSFEALLKRVGHGQERWECRPAAVEGLGVSALGQERQDQQQAREVLVDLTRDPVERVRLRAGRALSAIGGPGASEAVEAMMASHPAQDTPTIERWLARLRRGTEGAVTAVREELEKLQKSHRQLQEKVNDLEARSKTDGSGESTS